MAEIAYAVLTASAIVIVVSIAIGGIVFAWSAIESSSSNIDDDSGFEKQIEAHESTDSTLAVSFAAGFFFALVVNWPGMKLNRFTLITLLLIAAIAGFFVLMILAYVHMVAHGGDYAPLNSARRVGSRRNGSNKTAGHHHCWRIHRSASRYSLSPLWMPRRNADRGDFSRRINHREYVRHDV